MLGSKGDKANGGDNLRTYILVFPDISVPRPCPVEGFSGQASTRTAMRVHFWHRHVRDTVVILDEGKLPHPRCPLCDMMVPWKDLNRTHRRTEQCNRGTYRKRQKLAAEEERGVPTRAVIAYGRPMDMVTSFKYLGRVILAANDDWPVVVKNLSR